MSALIEFDEVCKYYQMGDTTVKAADHITMKIEKGEFVALSLIHIFQCLCFHKMVPLYINQCKYFYLIHYKEICRFVN